MSSQFSAAQTNAMIEPLEGRVLLSGATPSDAIPIDIEAGVERNGRFNDLPAVIFAFEAQAGEKFFFSNPQEFGSMRVIAEDGHTQLAEGERLHVNLGEQVIQWAAPRAGRFFIQLSADPYALT